MTLHGCSANSSSAFLPVVGNGLQGAVQVETHPKGENRTPKLDLKSSENQSQHRIRLKINSSEYAAGGPPSPPVCVWSANGRWKCGCECPQSSWMAALGHQWLPGRVVEWIRSEMPEGVGRTRRCSFQCLCSVLVGCQRRRPQTI